MTTKAKAYLEGPKQAEIIAVVGLLDLYGPDFYPNASTSAKDRYDWGVAHFEKEVGLERFCMFFAVHEFEAWLLSQPEIFPKEVKNVLPGAATAQPEKVNFNEPPAKLLDRIYKQATKKNYKKTTYGKQLFAKLDPAVAVQKCPYLKAMLEKLLDLAKAAGLWPPYARASQHFRSSTGPGHPREMHFRPPLQAVCPFLSSIIRRGPFSCPKGGPRTTRAAAFIKRWLRSQVSAGPALPIGRTRCRKTCQSDKSPPHGRRSRLCHKSAHLQPNKNSPYSPGGKTLAPPNTRPDRLIAPTRPSRAGL
jgi:hypothetical protein